MLHEWAFRRINRVQVGGTEICLSLVEYVIVRKLEFYREGGSDKHIRDIQSMLEGSAEIIDRDVLEKLIRERGLGGIWEKVS